MIATTPEPTRPAALNRVVITDLTTVDVRFETSATLDGSDAMNQSPDYSAAYVVLHTNLGDELTGHGLTFTNGRGNEVCVAAIEALRHLVVGSSLDEITANMGAFWRQMTGDSQLRWLGPEKGIIHLATAAIVNAVWDMWAKVEDKSLWQLISAMSPAEFVRCVDFRYITDAITPAEAVTMLEQLAPTKAARIADLSESGISAYVTSVGWLGYSDDKVRQLCRERLDEGWTNFKIKVGGDINDDVRRARLVRTEIGPDNLLMLDANQVWEVDEAIANMQRLAEVAPLWIEEPTSPDDVLGQRAIAQSLAPLGIAVASGEHCQNRVMFKQFLSSGAMGFCQIDACRLAGVNEVMAVLLLAAKYGVPVCPHSGGVGLSEYTQHLAAIDYICVSGQRERRMLEYSGHLDEHFRYPVVVRDGRYRLPTDAGYSIEMKAETLAWFTAHPGQTWPLPMAAHQ